MKPPMQDPEKKSSQGAGAIIAGAILVGVIAGVIAGQSSIGFLAGTGAGIVVALLLYMRDRKR
jgi:hypothetical protein